MLDENLPTYRFRPSSEQPLNTLLSFTHNGSEPSADMVLRRPGVPDAYNKYALGLFDMKYSAVLYGEVLVEPEWSQPTLSAAEVRAAGGSSSTAPSDLAAEPLVPASFAVRLYNPDQELLVRRQAGSWGNKDSWAFEVPERAFRTPSASQIDREAPGPQSSELAPRVNLRWRRDGRVSRDMTCYMSGRTVGRNKSKEPDITVALFKAGRSADSPAALTIYEPNMRRVDVEDPKGLEVVLLLTAEVIRDLYLVPRADPFNTAGAPPPSKTKILPATPPTSGAGAAAGAAAVPKQTVSEEERVRREQEEIKRMLEREQRDEAERQRRARADRERQVARETEELRRLYGTQSEQLPQLPPRPSGGGGAGSSGGGGGGGGAVMSGGASGAPPQPPRPQSVGPTYAGPGGSSAARKKLNTLLQPVTSGPYGGSAAASMSTFFGGGGSSAARTEEDKRRKAKKKRSVHF